MEYRPKVCVCFFKQIFISDRISTVLSPKTRTFPDVQMLLWPAREKSQTADWKAPASAICCKPSDSNCSPCWRAKSQTVTAGSPVWLRWEGHNSSSVPACSRANTARRATGAPVSTSCLCWPTVTLHPSEVTPAALHKVNLPLKIWYLLTCLIEFDGCMTFIEFFISGSSRASERLGCYSSWARALAGIQSPPQTEMQTSQPCFTDHHTED